MEYKILRSKDDTIKISFKECHAVIIPTREGRNALCVSCQIGCPVGCKFCFTGKQGFKRNLTSEEIIEQFEIGKKELGKIPDTVVFMGMGEPTLNLENVLKAADYFHQAGLKYNHITISTSCPNKEKLNLLTDLPYGVAVSLHSPFDSARKKVMPSSASVEEIVEFTKRCFNLRKKRTVLIEYALIKDFNDSDKDLKKLISLDWPDRAMFNLIEFNEVDGFKMASDDKFEKFKKGIIDSGWKCFRRQARGKDIGAACGMLELAR